MPIGLYNLKKSEIIKQRTDMSISSGKITVYDNIVPQDLQLKIRELTSGPIWQYGWKSNARRDKYCFWNARFAGGNLESLENCENELRKNTHATSIYELWKCLENSLLAGHEPIRVYANNHTYGVEGYAHTDSEEDGYFSTIYYAHQNWHRNWAGELVFFEQGGQDIIKSVYPKPGRVVQFPGRIPHAARAPSRECCDSRISVVIKTIKR